MSEEYTAIVRKSKLEYVAVCLELNVSAQGEDLASVEKNLRNAIELYLEDIRDNPETTVSPISVEAFIEFVRDTEPEWYTGPSERPTMRCMQAGGRHKVFCTRPNGKEQPGSRILQESSSPVEIHGPRDCGPALVKRKISGIDGRPRNPPGMNPRTEL